MGKCPSLKVVRPDHLGIRHRFRLDRRQSVEDFLEKKDGLDACLFAVDQRDKAEIERRHRPPEKEVDPLDLFRHFRGRKEPRVGTVFVIGTL